ncbi:MAG: zinc-ribbon domain-containing protein [Candidatus Bathyarchaeia archaeon]|jgi:hypothetical protein
MERTRISKLFLKLTKTVALTICFVLLFSIAITPLHAQLTPARDLTGTWQSSVSGTYYDMDPSDPNTKMNDITATFAMDITQQGNQIDIILSSNIISYHTDSAYYNEYGFNGVPEAGGMSIEFAGTVSSSSFSADEQGSQLTQEHLSGTFTTDIITATLTGTSETTDQNGIVVILTSSPTTAPTQIPTSNPTYNPTSRFFGNIGAVQGQANIIDPNGGETSAVSGQIGSGTQILTGDNSIVSFTPPNQGGTVYLGSNSEAGWVGLTSQPAPDNGIVYSVFPPSVAESTNWREGFWDMVISMPLEATIAVVFFSETIGTAAAVAVVVEGGVYLLHHGSVYVDESVSHLVDIAQGVLAGLGTEYVVNVSSDGTATVQVISGSVAFIDPITNNTITVGTDQLLTLPPKQQSGFTTQELQNDVSTFNPDSVNQWWAQAAQLSSSSLLDQPLIVMVLVIAITLLIAAPIVTISKRRTKGQTQSNSQSYVGLFIRKKSDKAKKPMGKMAAEPSQATVEQPEIKFCANCGKQLPLSKKFCPFCGFELNSNDIEST